MSGYFLVRQARGPEWDPERGRREQAGWDDHVVFMEALEQEGTVLLGGPIGEVNGEHAVLVMRADSAADVRERLAADPWDDRILRVESVEPWTLWIDALGAGPA